MPQDSSGESGEADQKEYTSPSKKPRPFSGPSPDNLPERREPSTTTPSPSDIFFEGRGETRADTKSGVDITVRPGSGGPEGIMAGSREEIGPTVHPIGPASEAYVNEPRDRRSEKKGDTK